MFRVAIKMVRANRSTRVIAVLAPSDRFPEGISMRTGLVSLIGMIGVLAWAAQDGTDRALPKRFGIAADLKTYPQAAAKETLASVLKAVDAKRADYILAHLADPDWVDRRVNELDGGFMALIQESESRLTGDPGAVKRLKKLSTNGEWKIGAETAVVRLKDMDEESLFFRKSDGRWYVENRKK
jgi:hypothetical protein